MSNVHVIYPKAAKTLREVLQPIVTAVAYNAAAVDQGDAGVRESLSALGSAGLLALGSGTTSTTLADQAWVIRTLAQECLATAFATWAQRMAIEYVTSWGTDALKAQLLADMVAGDRAGATAMATAFQDVLGLRELPVTIARDGDEMVLNGTLPWASNLFADGAVVVLPARSKVGTRVIVAVTTDRDGFEPDPCPSLLALGSTASSSVQLRNVRVPATWVLTTQFTEFLGSIRAPFLLLQTALCLGLTDAALAGAEGRFTGLARILEADHQELNARRSALSVRHQALLETDGPAGKPHLELRLAAATLAVAATRHEANVRGGASYLAASPTARRLREAAFLPVQSPTEAQLRWELAHFE
jgi:alkylation response protein AidB-like acyl-CoA dehydrogenase